MSILLYSASPFPSHFVQRSSHRLEDVLTLLSESGASYDRERVDSAYEFARAEYGGIMHWTGVTKLEHALRILYILAPFEPDEDSVIACILHHVLDSGTVSLLEVEQQFGPKVRSLVSGIHLLSKVTLEGRRKSPEDLRVMLLSVSDDIRIILITLCDRCSCLEYIGSVSRQQAVRLCQDILQLFAPVAARLGIYSLKHRLERGAFPVVYPDDAEKIEEELVIAHSDFPDFLGVASEKLDAFLQEQGIDAMVEAREKLPYSLFLKMHRKSVSNIRDIHDLFALRVIVDTEEDCYRVLGLLHRLGRPVANRFKDFISFPKPNGYQSLHTTLGALTGMPEGAFVEVQIRTKAMHREAKFGVAAHWSYKELGATERAMEQVQLHSMILSQQSIGEDETSSFADHIFVLTPKGTIVELPEGATPLDFAFQVHTDLGLSFRSARVNGSIVPLDYILKNGDVVEIIKHKNPQPSPQWMQQLKMASNRGKLRKFLHAKDRPKYITLGRELLNAELEKQGLQHLNTDLSLLRILDGEKLDFHAREDVLAKVGQNAERASSVLARLDLLQKDDVKHGETGTEETPQRASEEGSHVVVDGDIPMPVRYARCCEPHAWPRGPIVGNVNRRGEVMVHREDCRMVSTTNPGRRIGVSWAKVLA